MNCSMSCSKACYEMDRIVHGELAPGRVTRFTEPEVKQIRMNTGLSQKQFATADWCEQTHTGKLGTGSQDPCRTRQGAA